MDEDQVIPRRSAYTEAIQTVGLRTVQAIRQQGMRVVWAHQWRLLWGWHWDAKEALVEIVLDPRVPDELRRRAAALCEREITELGA